MEEHGINSATLIVHSVKSRDSITWSQDSTVPEFQIKKLQRVLNASALLVYCAPKCCHITPLLWELHWLPEQMRIDFKILLITFKILQGLAPSYLKNLVSVLPASHYQLHQNNNGILLVSSRLKTKKDYGGSFVYGSYPSLVEQPSFVSKAS